MIRVSVTKRLNTDRSYTYSLRWMTNGQTLTRRAIRSGPKPTRAELRRCLAKARGFAADREAELNRPCGTVTPLTLAQARDDFLDWSAAMNGGGMANAAPTTIQGRRRYIDSFIDYLEAHAGTRAVGHLDEVRVYDVAAWRDAMLAEGAKAGSVCTMLACVSAWFRWGEDHGHCEGNPAVRVGRPKVEASRAILPIRNHADLFRLLDAMETERRRAAVLLLATTGMRRAELAALHKADWDPILHTLHVRRGRETTKLHERTIPLPAQATVALEALAGHQGPLVMGTQDGTKPLTTQIYRWLSRHGVRPHDLRRFYITAMETIGAPKRVIDDLVGHSPGKVRAAYTPAQNLEESRPWVTEFSVWLGWGAKAGRPESAADEAPGEAVGTRGTR